MTPRPRAAGDVAATRGSGPTRDDRSCPPSSRAIPAVSARRPSRYLTSSRLAGPCPSSGRSSTASRWNGTAPAGAAGAHPPLRRLVLDHLAAPAAEELGVHQVVVLEEDLAEPRSATIRQRTSSIFGGRRELGGLDEQEAVADRLLAHELGEDGEQDVVLAGHVERVADGVGAVPVLAQHRLPAREDLHPVPDLGVRRDPDGLAEVGRAVAGEGLELARR